MSEKMQRFTSYNDGENGVLLGYGKKIAAGQEVKKGKRLYTVEEVHQVSGGLWTASLLATGTGRER